MTDDDRTIGDTHESARDRPRQGRRKEPGTPEPDHHEEASVTAAKRAVRERALARLVALPPVAAARTVFAFASFSTEVDTLPFLQWCLDRGVTVATPRIEGPHHMEAYAVTELAADFVSGHHLIPEPRPGLPLVDPADIDVVVLPGTAFDERGGRLGYGGGFYDTYLGRVRAAAPRVGICFEAQLVETVPRAAHDLCVDLIVTERRVIETGCREPA